MSILKTKLPFFVIVILAISLVYSCSDKKDEALPPPVPETKDFSWTENFDSVGKLGSLGWVILNKSLPLGTESWKQGVFERDSKTGGDVGFPAHSSSTRAQDYIYAGTNCGSGTSTISAWLITPSFKMKNGDKLIFFTRTTTTVNYPDRMQVRLNSTNDSYNIGNSEMSVGDFTTLLVDINPNLIIGTATTGYPRSWTRYEITFSGLTDKPKPGRVAFRYFVPNGGPSGANSLSIGVDSVAFVSAL